MLLRFAVTRLSQVPETEKLNLGTKVDPSIPNVFFSGSLELGFLVSLLTLETQNH